MESLIRARALEDRVRNPDAAGSFGEESCRRRIRRCGRDAFSWGATTGPLGARSQDACRPPRVRKTPVHDASRSSLSPAAPHGQSGFAARSPADRQRPASERGRTDVAPRTTTWTSERQPRSTSPLHRDARARATKGTMMWLDDPGTHPRTSLGIAPCDGRPLPDVGGVRARRRRSPAATSPDADLGG
jgi:hypothetical protein